MSLMALYQVIEDEKLINKAILLKDTTTLETLGCRMRSNIPIVESDDFDANGTIANVRVNVTYSAMSDGNYQCNGGTVDNLDIMPIKTLYKDTNGVNKLVTRISGMAFKDGQFSKVILPQKLETIADGVSTSNGAFYGCRNLQSVTFPKTLTEIGARAFYNCTGLTNIYIPKSVTKIGASAFTGCRYLSYVEYGGTMKEFEKAIHNVTDPFYGISATFIQCYDGKIG